MSPAAAPLPGSSTHDIHGGWNLAGEDWPDLDQSLALPRPVEARGHREVVDFYGSGGGPVFQESVERLENLPLGLIEGALGEENEPLPEGVALALDRAAIRSQEYLRSKGSERKPGGERHAPRKGDVLGGFRIIAELGRGAFARVYLAEQTSLGDRLVALKVSKAEGEEPQILARLQHTHIVPIHSVHDDPETGLRLLCMPYLGGANLAQVLEAVGENPSEGGAARSLVGALDEVSQRQQSRMRSDFSTPGSYRSVRDSDELDSRLAARPPADQHGSASGEGAGWRHWAEASTREGNGRRSLERLHCLWDRFAHRGAAPSRRSRRRLDDRDFDQPARQFLREANSVQAAAWVIARLAEGLEHAHSRGLLHRDLKPSNILIAADGTPMLLDFNLSTPRRLATVEESEKAMLGGTLPYMAPEHLDAFNPNGSTPADAVDERSDIYALGLILFEILAGAHPFPEPSKRPLLETLKAMSEARKHPPSLRQWNRAVPWSLDAVVRRCLAYDPAKRYPRARELAEDLNRFLDDLPLKHTREPSARERWTKWARRNPRLCGNTSIAGFSSLLIIALGGLIGLLHGNMQHLTSRLHLQVFRDDVAQCRFLLSVASGPEEHLNKGLALAERTLDHQKFDREGNWKREAWPLLVSPAEQKEVRERTAELILQSARARVHIARKGRQPSEVKAAERWAVGWLGLAERLETAPPATLFGDRAAYLADLGREAEARADREKEASRPASTSRDFLLLGESHLASGDLARAAEALGRSVQMEPSSFWAWFTLGHCHFEQGRPLDAAGDFAACVALMPRFSWPHMNRGLALARAGRLTEARLCYDQALLANPRFAEAWLNRALVDLELNRLEDADLGLKKALALGVPGEPAVLAAWAEVKARRGDRAGALGIFSRLLAYKPDDPVVLTARGIFLCSSDPEAARADLGKALSSNPKLPRAHFGLALLLRKDDPRASLGEAELALREDPGFLDALQFRAVTRARLGDLAAVEDAERLATVPTAHRLYNAACTFSLLIEKAHEPRFAGRALDLLDRALESGFNQAHARADPDLNPLRGRPEFVQILEKPRGITRGG